MNASDATNAILGVVLKSLNLQLNILTALTQKVAMPTELREATSEAVKNQIALNNQTIGVILDALELDADSDCNTK